MPFALIVNQMETVFEIVLGFMSFFSTWTMGEDAYWKDADKWYINILEIVKWGVGIAEIFDGLLGLYSLTYIDNIEDSPYDIID